MINNNNIQINRPDQLHDKIIKVPIVDDAKKRISYELWNVGDYRENSKSYNYTINKNEEEYTITASKLIKKITQNKWKVYNDFVTRAVDPQQYLQLIARDKVKRKYFYNNPNEADETVCEFIFFYFL